MRTLYRVSLALTLFVSSAANAVTEQALARDESLLFLQGLDSRVADVAWRIARASASLCPIRTNSLGLSIHDAAQYAPRLRETATATFGFRDGLPSVLAVARGGPADRAGILVGDAITAIDGKVLPRVQAEGKESYASISAAMVRLEQLPDRAVAIDFIREGAPRRIMLEALPVCRSRVEVAPGSQINANSNGEVVQIYGRLVLWARNDDELAIIVAHEMAHNLLAHNYRIESEKIGTGILSSFGQSGRKLRAMEREADRYGLYLVARAGYDYKLAGDLWRRLAATSGLGAIWATTHPTAKDRGEFNDAVAAEIGTASAEGLDLVP